MWEEQSAGAPKKKDYAIWERKQILEFFTWGLISLLKFWDLNILTLQLCKISVLMSFLGFWLFHLLMLELNGVTTVDIFEHFKLFSCVTSWTKLHSP